MPGMSGMSNEEIAEVLSYIRKEFGDGAPAVDPATIESVRSELGGRTEPWTIETLMR